MADKTAVTQEDFLGLAMQLSIKHLSSMHGGLSVIPQYHNKIQNRKLEFKEILPSSALHPHSSHDARLQRL